MHKVAAPYFETNGTRTTLREGDQPEQIDKYEITINGFQVRKVNAIGNVIFGLRYGKPSSALGCSLS